MHGNTYFSALSGSILGPSSLVFLRPVLFGLVLAPLFVVFLSEARCLEDAGPRLLTRTFLVTTFDLW